MKHTLIHGNCLGVIDRLKVDCIFADPPDNLGLSYPEYDDNQPESEYLCWLTDCLLEFLEAAPIVWLSYNAKWTFKIGKIIEWLRTRFVMLKIKPCVQIFTFGQYNQNDLSNCYRPLLRLRRDNAPLYPDQIRIPSWRQRHDDKRADPRGRVPGDVFDFPRVTGNSHQRRSWCPTQLHEGLIERCIKFSTLEGDTVLDPFAGTGTTLRVCKRINRQCTLIEQSLVFCEEIAREHNLDIKRAK